MDFRPDFFILPTSVAPDRELQPGESFHWEGMDIQVVATPGPTDGSVSYILEADGQKFAFAGDLIYGSGQLWNFYTLQEAVPWNERGLLGIRWGGPGSPQEPGVGPVVQALHVDTFPRSGDARSPGRGKLRGRCR